MDRLPPEIARRCTVCQTKQNLTAHHMIFQCNTGISKDYNNLDLLCEGCHKNFHLYYAWMHHPETDKFLNKAAFDEFCALQWNPYWLRPRIIQSVINWAYKYKKAGITFLGALIHGQVAVRAVAEIEDSFFPKGFNSYI